MDSKQEIERLKSAALLHHLSEDKLKELIRYLAVKPVKAGTIIVEEGTAGDSMFLLAEGQVRIEKRVEAGGSKELALLVPGDFFGEMALMVDAPRTARAVALTDAVLFVLGRNDLQNWLKSEPVMALGFFVELLRVLSQRLRATSEELVLLYDISHLIIQKFEDESSFLKAVLRRMIPHLDGKWSGAAYHYSDLNDAVTRVSVEGPKGAALPATISIRESANRWLDAGTFCVVLPGKTGTPLGFIVAVNEVPMSAREKTEFAITLTAASHLLASALQNIKHDAEEAMRARLEHQKAYGTSF